MSKTDLTDDLDKLRADIEALRNDVAGIVRSIADLGGAKGQETLAHAEELRLRAREGVSRLEERLGREIEERPFASVLTAFAVGFVLGKLFDSSR